MGNDPQAQEQLAGNLVERFVPIDDGDYDDIPRMLAMAKEAEFLTIR